MMLRVHAQRPSGRIRCVAGGTRRSPSPLRGALRLGRRSRGRRAVLPDPRVRLFLPLGPEFIVYNGGGVSCRRATKLIKGFVLGHPKQHGTSDADSYWTIKGEPGFRCIQAMGEGQCFKDTEIAGYRIKA